MPIHEVQVKRNELRQLWIGQLMPEVVSQMEALENTEGKEREMIQLLSRLREMTDEHWFERLSQEHMERNTPPAAGSTKPGWL